MQIRNAIVVVAFVIGFAVAEAVMIDEPDLLRPMRERAAMRIYGRPADDAEDTQSIHRRAVRGDAQAQYNLGVIYEGGYDIPQDYEEAVKWFRLAAEQGYVSAQKALGDMYADGHGVSQNDAKAREWHRRAEMSERKRRADAKERHLDWVAKVLKISRKDIEEGKGERAYNLAMRFTRPKWGGTEKQVEELRKARKILEAYALFGVKENRKRQQHTTGQKHTTGGEHRANARGERSSTQGRQSSRQKTPAPDLDWAAKMLGISREAIEAGEGRMAYKQAMMLKHPDRRGGTEEGAKELHKVRKILEQHGKFTKPA